MTSPARTPEITHKTAAAIIAELSGSTCPERRPRVHCLIRVSTAGQALDGRAGLARQRFVCEQVVKSNNLECVETLELCDVSGTAVLQNPQIQRLLRLISEKEIDGIVASDLDRVLRPGDPSDYQLFKYFQDADATIWTSGANYRLSNKDGMFMGVVRSAVGEMERRIMLERAAGAKEAKRKQGRNPNSYVTLPLGVSYDRKAEKYFYNDQISRIQDLFRLFDEGERCYSQLERITGIQKTSVKNLLQNRLFIGERCITEKRGPTRLSKGGVTYRSKIKRADSEIIEVKVIETPAVPLEVFERVQAHLAVANFNNLKKTPGANVSLASGIAFCGYCGRQLWLQTKTNKNGIKRRYMQCRANTIPKLDRVPPCPQSHLRQDQADQAISELITGMLNDPKILGSLIEDALTRNNQTIVQYPQPEGIEGKLTELRKKSERLTKAYLEGVIPVEELKELRAGIQRDSDHLTRIQRQNRGQHEVSKMETARLIVKAASRFSECSDDRSRKEVILEILSAVTFKNKAITRYTLQPGALWAAGERLSDGLSITLRKPIKVGPVEIPVEEGFRRCRKCGVIKPDTEFYRSLTVCSSPCRKTEERRRHLERVLKRKAAKAKDSPGRQVAP